MGEKYRLNIPRLNVLSREKLELIHHSTLEVLRRTGVAVKEPVTCPPNIGPGLMLE
jgi:trimethylamine:corrinoid methyltransferase-like protein